VCSSQWSAEDPEQQFIVRFHEYRQSRDWKLELENILGEASSQWRWIDRENAAASFPTDFGVIRLSPLTSDMSKEKLMRHDAVVKDIHPDQMLRRDLAMYDENEEGSASFFKPKGRFRTRPTFGIDSEDDEYTYDPHDGQELRRRLQYRSHSVTDMLDAGEIWKLGYSGQNIRVGVFDTGIRGDHPHIKHIKERTNWTHQNTLSDGLGHGSFVAGVIAGNFDGCPGFAPDVEVFTFKVFTDDQVSYTSWFLDAFNYAMVSDLHIVNLSIGGPDFLDQPFVEKVLEVTSSGIIMLSAIGNDGPLYGTLNNPADQNDVIGIGGMNYQGHIARFSSRGMSTWELPLGYGRIKPDVLAYAQDVSGSKIQGGCRTLSGTSVASPVAAGAVALLASTVPEEVRFEILNPASMKQALVEAAFRLPDDTIYVQGTGRIDLAGSMEILQNYSPRASLIPASLDLTDCPYMWPFCTQPIYANAVPLIINATVLNGMSVTGVIPEEPVFIPSDDGGQLLSMEFEYSDVLWPWSGYLAIYIHVQPSGKFFSGTASGEIQFSVVSPAKIGEREGRISQVTVPFTVEIIPTPPREKRILWDQFHSVKYPPGYFPRDNLDVHRDILDWHGDHPHTNFHEMYDYLRKSGYYVEVLGSPYTCFRASEYGALFVVDSEDVFYEEEVAKLRDDVENKGLGLIVFAEWYNAKTAENFRFFDDNTRSWWTPATGGGNIPGLNVLLSEFGIAFGDAVLKGTQVFGNSLKVKYSSGSNIIQFPPGGYLHSFSLEDTAIEGSSQDSFATLGLTESGNGRVAVYGDSNCLDSSYQSDHCFALLHALLDYVNHEEESELLKKLLNEDQRILTPWVTEDELPRPIEGVDFSEVSFVLSNPLACYKNSPMRVDIEPEDMDSKAVERQEKPEAGRNVYEVTNVIGDTPDEHNALTGERSDSYQTEGWNPSLTGGVTSGPNFRPSQGFAERAPPLLMSKWSALFGVLVMFGLYKLTRRRRQPVSTSV